MTPDQESRIAYVEGMLLEAVREAGEPLTGDLRVGEQAAAQLLGVAVKTLRNWRAQLEGPRYYRAGRISYRLRDLAEFIERSRDFP